MIEAIHTGDIIEKIEVSGITNEGQALARVDGFVIFVEDAVPGDIVDARVYRKKKKLAEAKLIKIHTPSPDRREPFCSHFGLCGGCTWQHLSYEKQLFYKQQQVEDALVRIGKIQLREILPILGSAKTKLYRNRLDYTFSNRRWLTSAELNTEISPQSNVVGFHVPKRFDKIFQLETCHLQDNFSNIIRQATHDFAMANNFTYYDLRAHNGLMRNLVVRNSTSGEWMVLVVFGEDHEENRNAILNHLSTKFKEITSLLFAVNTKRNDSIFDQDIRLFSGKEFMHEKMDELSFKISAKSFYQTNSGQAHELYKIVRDFAALTGKENVYDLYTGTGTIACFVAAKSAKVIGIDYIPDAIRDANENAVANGISNAEFVAGDIKETLTHYFIEKNGKPDVILTDPPRAGMHPDVVKKINECEPERIVYVSCNPSTQARDLQILDSQYAVEKVQPVDMFPHTTHVENVVLLHRRSK